MPTIFSMVIDWVSMTNVLPLMSNTTLVHEISLV